MRLRRSAKVEKMLLNARGIEYFNLDNHFIADVVDPEHVYTCCSVMRDTYRNMKRSYVSQLTSNRYRLHIHSNCWYDFSVAGMK
jgi:hypothetical protein